MSHEFLFYHFLWSHEIQNRDAAHLLSALRGERPSTEDTSDASLRRRWFYVYKHILGHSQMENFILFPALQQIVKSSPELEKMIAEDHAVIADTLASLEETFKKDNPLDRPALADRVAAFVTMYKEHNTHETEVVRRIVTASVPEEQQREIGRRISQAAREDGTGSWLLPAFADHASSNAQELAKWDATMPWFVRWVVVPAMKYGSAYAEYAALFPVFT